LEYEVITAVKMKISAFVVCDDVKMGIQLIYFWGVCCPHVHER